MLAHNTVSVCMCICICSHGAALGTQVPRFTHDHKYYLKSKLLMEQVLSHREACRSKQKIWMKQMQLKTCFRDSVENRGLSVLSYCNSEKAKPTPLLRSELKFQ